jgi:nicotinamidase-related amidase
MPLLDSARSTLLVIDLQGRLAQMVHQPARTLEASRRLLKLAGLFAVPVLLTEQYPKGLGPTEASLLELFDQLPAPAFRLEKTAFSCCGDPDFAGLLAQARPGLAPGQHQIVVAGIEAHVCVVQTVLQLLEQGFQVQVCRDAVSGRGADNREQALARMAAAGATLTNHESVGFEWARHKGHPAFKALSALVKEPLPENT